MLTLTRRIFSKISKENRPLAAPLDSNLEEVISQRNKSREEIVKKMKQNLPVEQKYKKYQDSIVSILLYMRHDHWSSQYVYLMMNYYQLGFRRISDLGFLDRASYMLKLRKIEDEQRWPSVKVNIALDPAIILTGMDPIYEFFRVNNYFTESVEKNSTEITSLQKYIDENLLPYLESMFWHPLLTFQYTFHTNLSSYEDTTGGDIILSILMRNLGSVAVRSFGNIAKIIKHNEQYANSKQKLTAALRELERLYLNSRPFFGGDKPNHIDFYLLSHLLTKSNSKLFAEYLEKGIGKEFWSWWMRMSSLCQYNKDRVTLT